VLCTEDAAADAFVRAPVENVPVEKSCDGVRQGDHGVCPHHRQIGRSSSERLAAVMASPFDHS
jgi:hypothetical protein